MIGDVAAFNQRNYEFADLLDEIRLVRRSMPGGEYPETSLAAHYADLSEAERGSRAMSDRVVLVGDLWTLIASDQLGAVGTLIRRGEILGLFPVLRTSIEHSCAAFWVLDALVSPEVRAARAALAFDRSNEELKKAAQHLGGKDTATYQERLEIFQRFREQIVVEFPNDTDLAKGVIAGEPRRRPTEIMRHSGSHWGSSEEWEGTYDYLCATANHPSLAAFEFIDIEDGVRIYCPPESLERFLHVGVLPCIKAMQQLALLCESGTAPIEWLMNRTNEVFTEPVFVEDA